jgi:hypothetical protein
MIVHELYVTFSRQWATTLIESRYIGSNFLLVAARQDNGRNPAKPCEARTNRVSEGVSTDRMVWSNARYSSSCCALFVYDL